MEVKRRPGICRMSHLTVNAEWQLSWLFHFCCQFYIAKAAHMTLINPTIWWDEWQRFLVHKHSLVYQYIEFWPHTHTHTTPSQRARATHEQSWTVEQWMNTLYYYQACNPARNLRCVSIATGRYLASPNGRCKAKSVKSGQTTLAHARTHTHTHTHVAASLLIHLMTRKISRLFKNVWTLLMLQAYFLPTFPPLLRGLPFIESLSALRCVQIALRRNDTPFHLQRPTLGAKRYP